MNLKRKSSVSESQTSAVSDSVVRLHLVRIGDVTKIRHGTGKQVPLPSREFTFFVQSSLPQKDEEEIRRRKTITPVAEKTSQTKTEEKERDTNP